MTSLLSSDNKTLVRVQECNICGSTSRDWERLFSLNGDRYLEKCNRCGLIFNSHQVRDLQELYSTDFFVGRDKSGSEEGYFDYSTMRTSILRTYQFASDFIIKHSGKHNESIDILDVGCGYGYFLQQFESDERFRLQGVELNDMAAGLARESGLDVANVRFEDFVPDREYDFVTMFEFIEHTLDPAMAFEKAAEIVKPGAHVLLTTPNAGSILFNLLKRRWPYIHCDTHNYYYSPETIDKLAEKTGFGIVNLKKSQYIYTSGLQLRKRLSRLLTGDRYSFEQLSFMDRVAVPFPCGGNMKIALRKV
jgi:2-polyprenyl-3-methyl-5-hydroxy-6-metoxy-1,4-benzoquinol methylase